MVTLGYVPKKKGKGKPTIPDPPWNELLRAKDDIGGYIDVQRLPTSPGFRFIHPLGMTSDEAVELACHIIKGELGLIPEENRFQWKGQAQGISLPPQMSAKEGKKVNSLVATVSGDVPM